MHRNVAKHRLVAIVALAALAAVSLTGCSALLGSSGGGSGTLIFENKAEAAGQGSHDVPAWVPDDAQTIRVVFPASGPGYLMSFRSATGVAVSPTCTAGPADIPLQPTISASWWPKTAPRADRRHCGDAQVARAGDEWYVWDAAK